MEVLVGGGVLLLLLSALYLLLVFGLRYYRAAYAVETVHQQSLLTLRKLSAELRRSHPATVTYGPGFVWFLSPDPPTATPGPWTYASDGSLEWHTWIGYYLNGTELVRSELPLGTPALVPPVPAAPTLTDFQVASSRRTVAREIQTLNAAAGTAPELVELVVTARVPTASNKFTEVTLRTQVHPEN
ncbi:MAG: hypothetical protein AB1758_25365 [Candidatus Eremiobacterota bacterium]